MFSSGLLIVVVLDRGLWYELVLSFERSVSGPYRQGVHRDLDSIRDEYLRLREKILRELEGSTNAEQTRYLRSELDQINQKLGSLQGFSTAYIQRHEHLKQPI